MESCFKMQLLLGSVDCGTSEKKEERIKIKIRKKLKFKDENNKPEWVSYFLRWGF